MSVDQIPPITETSEPVSEGSDVIWAKKSEEAVLGSLLSSSGDVMRDVLPLLGSTDEAFYDPGNKLLWRAMVSLHNQGKPTDMLEVESELEAQGTYERIGGFSRLVHLTNVDAIMYHAAHYAKRLVDAHAARRRAWAAQQIIRLCYQKLPAEKLEAQIDDVIRASARPLTAAWRGRIMGETLPEAVMRDHDERGRDGYKRPGLIMGIPPLDARLGPLEGGDLTFVLAPTSTGKTILSLMAVRANAQAGERPVFYFNELSMRRLRNRLVVMESTNYDINPPTPMVSVDELSEGRADPEELNIALNALYSWSPNAVFVPAHGWTAEEIVADFTSLWTQGLCSMVLIDYIDLVAGGKSENDNLSTAIGDKIMVLKNGAAACKLPGSDGIPILITGQPPKGFSSQEVKRPTMDDAYGSVRSSQFAFKFLTLWRERNERGLMSGRTLLRIEKNPDDGNEGYEESLRVAGTKERRGFMFYPAPN